MEKKEMKDLMKKTTKYCMSRGLQESDADDICQDYMLIMVENNSYTEFDQASVDRLIKKFKNNVATNSCYPYDDNLNNNNDNNDNKSTLVIDMTDCTEYEYDIIDMRKNNLSFNEIAELLHKDSTAIRVQYHRTIKKLKELNR